jgi:hypothetical protein
MITLLSVPCRPGTPVYKLQSKIRSKMYCHIPYSYGSHLPTREGFGATTCFMASDHASLHGRAPTLSRVPWLWTLPPCSGGLRCCHVPHGSGPWLPTREGSGASTCLVALDPASLLRRAPALPRTPWLWTLPPCSGGLRHHHVPRGFKLCLLAREGSNVATCPVDLNGPQTSWTKKALASLGMQLDSRISKASTH